MSNKPVKTKNNEPILEWISFPFVDRPSTSALLSVFLLILSYLLKEFIKSIQLPVAWWIAGMLLIFISLLPYFIPSRYKFYKKKVVAHYWFYKLERPYTDFKCFYSDKWGVMLGTFQRPRRLDPFRGMSIRYSKSQAEKPELLEFLAEKIGNKF
jgi:hypothetical protein